MTYQKMAFGLALASMLAGFTNRTTQHVAVSLPKSTARQLHQNNAVAAPTATIPFTVVQHYFVKNTAKGAPTNPRIDDKTAFNKLFGAAAVMGKNGQPTSVDFARQSVIAVIIPETNRATELLPISLTKSTDGELVFTYTKKTGPSLSYTVRPFLAVLIDKSMAGRVVLDEQR